MKLTVVGSGSQGNTYLLHNETECLVLDAGIPFKEVKKALDFNILKIKGVICTHKHKDHVGYVKEYINAGIRVIAPTDFWNENFMESWFQYGERFDETRKTFNVGNFIIQLFPVVHDVPCYGFYIKHEEIGKLLYITDTEYVPQNFKKLAVNHILIECNYSKEYIDENYDQGLRNRVLETHMELQTCKSFIQANMTTSLYNVCLVHLSASNGNPTAFRDEINDICNCNVFVAKQGLEIELESTPF